MHMTYIYKYLHRFININRKNEINIFLLIYFRFIYLLHQLTILTFVGLKLSQHML